MRMAAAELHEMIARGPIAGARDGRRQRARESTVAKFIDVLQDTASRAAAASASSASVRRDSSGSILVSAQPTWTTT